MVLIDCISVSLRCSICVKCVCSIKQKKIKKIEIKVKKNKTKNLFILPVCSFCFTIEYMQENQKTNFLNIQLYKTYTNNSSESD